MTNQVNTNNDKEREDIFDSDVLMSDNTKSNDLKHESNNKSFLFKSIEKIIPKLVDNYFII